MSAQDSKLLQERQFDILSDLLPFPTPTTQSEPTSSRSPTSSAHSHSTPTTTSSSSTSTTSSSSSSSLSSSSILTSTTSSPPGLVTTIVGQTLTFTAPAGGQTSTISSSTPAHTTTFLQNKVLSGVVFGLAGLVGLILLITIVACAIKRRRNKKLLEEAVMFEPASVGTNYDDHLESGAIEKLRLTSSSVPFAEYAPHPYPTPYTYPATAPQGGVGQFQSASVQRHIAY